MKTLLLQKLVVGEGIMIGGKPISGNVEEVLSGVPPVTEYYLDLEVGGSGHAGTEIDPWSYSDYLSARTVLVTGSTVYVKGFSTVTQRPEVNTFGKWIIWNKWPGGQPWRICLAIPPEEQSPSMVGIILQNGIVGNTSTHPSRLMIGTDVGVPTSVTGQFIVNLAILNTSARGIVLIMVRNVEWKGCLVSSLEGIEIIGSETFSYYDTVFVGNIVVGGNQLPTDFVTYNCCFTCNAVLGIHTLPQWNWGAPPMPSWNSAKEAFAVGVLAVGITTPPQPGDGSPGYGGYSTDAWGNTRFSIGGFYFAGTNSAPTITSDGKVQAYSSVPYLFTIQYICPMSAIDPDLDTLVWSLITAPTGMTIDPSSGLITWLPLDEQIGEHTVTVRVTDIHAAFDELTWTIVVSQGKAVEKSDRGPVTYILNFSTPAAEEEVDPDLSNKRISATWPVVKNIQYQGHLNITEIIPSPYTNYGEASL